MMKIYKRLFKKLIALLVITIIPIGLYIYIEDDVQFTLNINNSSQINKYHINAKFNPIDKEIYISQKVSYLNRTEEELEKIFFHIYPNAFKSEEVAPYDDEEIIRVYPNGFDPGFIDIKDVRVKSEKLDYNIIGRGDTVLMILLKEPVKPNEYVTIEIDSLVKIPNALGRFGYGEYTFNIGNWYPVAAVYDQQGWNLDPYHKIGDPFYSDISDYHVELTVPKGFEAATSGIQIKEKKDDSHVTYHFEADKVRDFMMVISDKFSKKEKVVEDTKVISYYFNEKYSDEALQYAVDSIRIFNVLFGKYPYSEYRVVASDFLGGGMEYPNIVIIDNNIYDYPNPDILEYIIVHETAHQWWYGVIGNDQIEEAWLDESLTEYSTILYYEEKYGKETSEKVFEIMIKNQYEYLMGNKDNEEAIRKGLDEFETWQEYTALVYNKGAIILNQFRETIGDEKFFEILTTYYTKFMFKNATTWDFIDVCSKVLNWDYNKISEGLIK